MQAELSRESQRYAQELGMKHSNEYEWHLARIIGYSFDWDHNGIFTVQGEYTNGNLQSMALHIESGYRDETLGEYVSLPIFRRLFIEEFMTCVGVSRLDDLKNRLVYFLKRPSEGQQGFVHGFAYPPFTKHKYDNRFCIVKDWVHEQRKMVKSMAEGWLHE